MYMYIWVVDSDLTARLSDVRLSDWSPCATFFGLCMFAFSSESDGPMDKMQSDTSSDLTRLAVLRSSLEIAFLYLYLLSDEPEQTDCTRLPDWSIVSDWSDRPILLQIV